MTTLREMAKAGATQRTRSLTQWNMGGVVGLIGPANGLLGRFGRFPKPAWWEKS
jgi:hypothetical protein